MAHVEPIKTNGRAYNVSPVVLSWYAWFPTDAYYISSDDDRNTGESKKESAKKIVKQIGKRAERLIEIIAWNDASNEKDYLGAAIPQ